LQGGPPPTSWALDTLQRSRLLHGLYRLFYAAVRWSSGTPAVQAVRRAPQIIGGKRRAGDFIWFALLLVLLGLALWRIALTLIGGTTWGEAGHVAGLACITLARVMVLIGLASVVWVPIGIWVGLRPRVTEIVQPIAQFLAAFPSNLLFGLVFYAIVSFQLNPDVWLSPLIILGTQWYILFNVIAGAAAMPTELRYVTENLGVGGRLWWRRIALPEVFPYYVTGAITASGGAWNASVVAEVLTWGNSRIEAHGLGAYIADATSAGDFHRVILGITTMSLFVIALNRLLWRPLYYYAERKFRLT
jgi:NitT/TauT family transport system permease protein